MPTINLQVKYNLDTNRAISAKEIRSNYLFGLQLEKFGKKITDQTINFYVNIAQKQIESLLQVKLSRQLVTGESTSFFGSDFQSWGFMRSIYPVVCPIALSGFLGTVLQVIYPTEWMSVPRSSDQHYSRLINIVPNTGGATNQGAVYSGILPNVNFGTRSQNIPNYWTLSYVTGFDPVPEDIRNAVAMLAVIQILAVASDALIRFPGLSSSSISLDGLSQSTSTFANANSGIFGARIRQYRDALYGGGGDVGLISYLIDQYNTPQMTTM